MKNKTINIVLWVLMSAGLSSCLADAPFDKYDSDFIFSSQIKAEGYVLSVYQGLPFDSIGDEGYCRVDGAMLACATDEATMSKEGSSIVFLTDASLTSRKENPDGCWTNAYKFIRDANIGLENLDKMPESYQSLKERLRGELIFLKAYQYFELVKRYGGVPILDVVKSPSEGNIPRSSFEDCIDYITDLCDEAEALLPDHQTVSFGRASKGAADALKARVLLYAASPLYNGTGYNASSNELVCYGTYDKGRWEVAAEAAAKVIASGEYSLYIPNAIGDSASDVEVIDKGTENYRNLFTTIAGNKELVFSRTASMTNSVEKQQLPYGIPNAKGIVSPSQQMVDAYGMVNGKGIDDAGSGYSEDAPYEGRDPRFYASIFYNGQMWNGTLIETYQGGLHNNASDATKTGYYLSKFCSENVVISGNANSTYHCFPLIRYAEVLLDYAEAVNEAFGPDSDPFNCGLTAREAVELVRSRVLRPQDAAVNVQGVDNMREFIRDERRVELAFEDHRYFDLKRWMKASDVLNENIQGMQITKNGTDYIYRKVNDVAVRQFTDKFYVYPLPNSEVMNNPSIKVNNPMW